MQPSPPPTPPNPRLTAPGADLALPEAPGRLPINLPAHSMTLMARLQPGGELEEIRENKADEYHLILRKCQVCQGRGSLTRGAQFHYASIPSCAD